MRVADDAFRDRTVFVTGGGTGLGLEVSRRFGAKGANVVVASRDRAHHSTIVADGAKAGFSVLSLATDVTKPDEVKRAVREAADRFGGIDVLVNNAAGNFVRPAIRLAPKAFSMVIDIALNGVFTCSREVARVMAKRGRGAIVNISAPYAATGKPGVVHSACAKAGVDAMTRTLAAEWAPLGIRVNAVSPGPFESRGAADRLWPTTEIEESVRRQIPAGRFGTTAEVADLVVFLASDAASWVTGAVWVVDGGWSLPQGLVPGFDRVERRRAASDDTDAGTEGSDATGLSSSE